MKKKYLMFAALPAFTLVLVGAGVASARGMYGFGMNNLTPEQLATVHQEKFAREADLLGISATEVKNAWASGKTMRDLAAEKGISQETLHAKMQDLRKQQMKANLATLVSKGVITQAQADQRAQFIDSNTSTGRGFGKGGGRHGGGMGMMRGF